MEQLTNQLTAVAKEYCRQFADLLGTQFEYFVADDPTDMACFGDVDFFSLSEIRQVIDNLPRYIERYGSKEAVAQEIRDWQEWWLYPDGQHFFDPVACIMPRVTHVLLPNISLEAWLSGCPRKDTHPWNGPDADYLRLKNDRDTLERLIKDYGPDNDLKSVMEDITADLARETAAKETRDAHFRL